jgi:hypothetical protein
MGKQCAQSEKSQNIMKKSHQSTVSFYSLLQNDDKFGHGDCKEYFRLVIAARNEH